DCACERLARTATAAAGTTAASAGRARREAALPTTVVLLHRALGDRERPRRVKMQQPLLARALGLAVAVRGLPGTFTGRRAAAFVTLVGHDQTFLTCAACRPLGPWTISNSTSWPSAKLRKPSCTICV